MILGEDYACGIKEKESRTSLVAQQIGIYLPMQGKLVRSLVWKDRAGNQSLCPTTTEARLPRACSPQQEKLPQREACVLQPRTGR